MILTVKTPSFIEFSIIIDYLCEELVGAQLQEIISAEDGLVLGFYRFHKSPQSVWLVYDLDNQFPFVGLYDFNPWPKTKKTKPLALFMNSHFKNTHLKSIQCLENFGRVALFDFSIPQQKLILELRLIPKQPNLIAQTSSKSISWEKPKELVEVEKNSNESYQNKFDTLIEPATMQQDSTDIESRGLHFMFKQWSLRRSKNAQVGQKENSNKNYLLQNPFDKWVKQKQKDIQKKQKAIEQILEQNQKLEQVPWSEIGEYLKVYGHKNLPHDWAQYIVFEEKISTQIEKCFLKAKQAQAKIGGGLQRIELLQKEISELSDLSEDKFKIEAEAEQLKKIKTSELNRKSTEASFRKLNFAEEPNVSALLGKSAAENVKILRQSKAWDIWVHLKDYPSAYAIIQKNKDKSLPDSVIYKTAEWLVKETVKNKKIVDGVKISVVYTECRHVRMIKGDKLGRVTYHHARELLITG